jgi:YVTN family beta-propeller protein
MDNTISVINTTSDTVLATIAIGISPFGVSASPDGSKVFVTNNQSRNVSVINTATNTILDSINIGYCLLGISISPDGSKVCVVAECDNKVFVINTSTLTVIDSITVGNFPVSFGNFISSFGTGIPSITPSTPSITIYPNPTNSILNIKAQLGIRNYELGISDVLGNEVYHETLIGIDNSIGITAWNAGIYFYEIRSEHGSERGKFVKE